jgi:hypothetical protein
MRPGSPNSSPPAKTANMTVIGETPTELRHDARHEHVVGDARDDEDRHRHPHHHPGALRDGEQRGDDLRDDHADERDRIAQPADDRDQQREGLK